MLSSRPIIPTLRRINAFSKYKQLLPKTITLNTKFLLDTKKYIQQEVNRNQKYITYGHEWFYDVERTNMIAIECALNDLSHNDKKIYSWIRKHECMITEDTNDFYFVSHIYFHEEYINVLMDIGFFHKMK
jgi:hypothetical protein